MFDGNFRTQVDAAVKPIGQSISAWASPPT